MRCSGGSSLSGYIETAIEEAESSTAVDTAWVPEECKLFLVFDPISKQWQAALRLRSDYLGYLSIACSVTMEGALAEVRTKSTYGIGGGGTV